MINNISATIGIILLVVYWWTLHLQFPLGTTVSSVNIPVLFYSLIGGILPALLWLWFWLKEDAKKPEPGSLIFLCFLAGMICVPIAIPLERAIANLCVSCGETSWFFVNKDLQQAGIGIIISWAFVEEALKLIAVYIVGFKSKFFDEPVDAMVYLITCALGFAAFENSLYLMGSLVGKDGGATVSVLNANLRFLGATLLHVISSSAIGAAVALSFYKAKKRYLHIFFGVIIATTLHVIFNLFIMRVNSMFETLVVFSYYWIIVFILIILFEEIKQLKPPKQFIQ
jgi:RsiW-degrading membrane proteinase PrsW (M82 family)